MNTQSSPWFQQLQYATHLRANLQALFAATLPKNLAGQYHVLEIRGTTLHVGTDNAGYATRLRYTAPEILPLLQRHHFFSRVSALHCMVIPPSTEYVPKRIGVTPISQATADAMKSVAYTITDTALRDAIVKLAENTDLATSLASSNKSNTS